MAARISKTQEFSLTPVLMGVLLFVSGLMITATPLPFVYVFLLHGQKNFLKTALLSLTIIFGIYFVGTEWAFQQLQTHPDSQWLMTLPMVPLLATFPKISVLLLGVGYFVFYLLVAFVIAKILLYPLNIYGRSLRAVLGLYLLVALALTLYILPQATQFLQHYNASVKTAVSELLVQIDQSSDIDSVSAIYFKTVLQQLGEHFIYFLPVLFFSSISFIFVLNLVVSKRLFFPFRPHLLLIRFTEFRLPFYFVWIAVGALGLILLNTQFIHIQLVTFLALNVLTGVLLIYFYQGLSVFVSVLDAKNIRGLWRVTIYILSIYLSLLSVIVLTSMGFFDSWIDVRKYLFARQER